MKTFREFINESAKIYRNEKYDKWSIDSEIQSFLSKTGHTIIGIGLLEKFFKKRQDSEFVFVYLGKNEKGKADEFKADNKNKSEILCRYVSRRTASEGMMPLCILNADKGYMRFMDNIDDDPELEDAEWSKPQKFNYLRTTF